ncbi:MAG: GIY-YIG nuclease family protein [Chloroflexota bacterium]|nr:GIY-YIG nuclease family protein [Chloroflexota bacterium]
MPKRYFVYMMTNRSGTLYTGMTNNLVRRVYEHQQGIGSTFTAKYRIRHLIYYEVCSDVRDAIAREKQIKSWRRSKKLALIESMNPEWRDLSADSRSCHSEARSDEESRTFDG